MGRHKKEVKDNEVLVNSNGKEYVNNAALLLELRKSKEQDQLTDNAIHMFMLMCENIQTKKLYYKDPEEKKDCASSAILDILTYWRNFDESKTSNPFAFFTSMISNGLAKGWGKLHPECKKCPEATFTSLDNINIYSF